MALISILRINIVIRYTESAEVFVKVLFFKFRVIPGKNKTPSKKTERKKIDDGKKGKDKKSSFGGIFKQEGFSGLISVFKSVFEIIKELSEHITKHLIFTRFNISVAVGSDDASDTAINYGIACSVIYPISSYILQTFNVKKYKLDINADYYANNNVIKADIKLYMRVMFVFIAAMRSFIKYVKLIAKNNDKKAVQNNGHTSN